MKTETSTDYTVLTGFTFNLKPSLQIKDNIIILSNKASICKNRSSLAIFIGCKESR
jgi:hypothetical protein